MRTKIQSRVSTLTGMPHLDSGYLRLRVRMMARSRRPSEEDRAEILTLRHLRKRAKKSQAWIAAAVGVSPQQWGKYERGEDRIPVGRFKTASKKLEEVLGGGAPSSFREPPSTPYQEGPAFLPSILAECRLLRGSIDRIEAWAQAGRPPHSSRDERD